MSLEDVPDTMLACQVTEVSPLSSSIFSYRLPLLESKAEGLPRCLADALYVWLVLLFIRNDRSSPLMRTPTVTIGKARYQQQFSPYLPLAYIRCTPVWKAVHHP